MNISQKKVHIIDNINELIMQDRKTVLQMLYNSPSRKQLKEKGSGTQIKIEDISYTLITKIYDFIEEKLKEQDLDFI